ncbi:hypothetical protein KIM372_00990 [Bombiscardovia nodaiensis]|uniref:MBG domain-containing protein n=1 Tax=Bombiscardovia nodaiensis TaxID=2932181 RepID=A0ABM8B5R1_9BIFI|nr:hypothetical protein KIM372_00990 [Bombiscardovia nodaiensis]
MAYLGKDKSGNPTPLASVVIPDSVKTIDDIAFAYSNIVSIHLPKQVETIGDSAFIGNHFLTTINLSEATSLKYIGDSAFADNTALPNVDLSQSTSLDYVGSSAFPPNLDVILPPMPVGTVADWKWSINADGQTVSLVGTNTWFQPGAHVKIPDRVTVTDGKGKTCTHCTVTAIAGAGMQWQPLNQDSLPLESLTIPDTVTSIAADAFYHSQIRTIHMPSSIQTIGEQAFAENKALTAVDFSSASGLQSIGDSAFAYDDVLAQLLLSDSDALTTIGVSAFAGAKGLTVLDLSSAVKLQSIGASAFAYNDKLATVKLPLNTENSSFITIGDNAFIADAIQSLTIPSSLQTIGASAFEFNTKLTSVDFSAATGLKTIGASAFHKCNLTQLDLSKSRQLDSIGNYAFKANTALAKIDLSGTALTAWPVLAADGTNPEDRSPLFDNGPVTDLKFPHLINKLPKFSDYFPELIHLALPDELLAVVDSSFMNRSKLETVKFGSDPTVSATQSIKLRTIGASAFSTDTALTALDLSRATALTSIGASAFAYEDSLASVNLSGASALVTIDDSAFISDKTLATVNLSGTSSLTSIGNSAFAYNDQLTSLNLSGVTALTTIGDSAFAVDKSLPKVDLSQATALASIGKSAFAYNDVLHEVTFPETDSFKMINDDAFAFSALETLTIPDSVQTIGDRAFKGLYAEGSSTNRSLTSVSLGSGLTSIGVSAFEDNFNLNPLTMKNGSSPLTIGEAAFRFCGMTQLTIADNVTSIGDQAFFSHRSNTAGLTQLTLGQSLKSIGSDAFSYHHNLANLDLSQSTQLTTIGTSAFVYDAIQNDLEFPPSLTTIGDQAFASNKIRRVFFQENLKSIGKSAFAYNIIDSVLADGVTKNPLTIPASVTDIGETAFAGNRISAVVIKGSSQVGKGAFSVNRITSFSGNRATYTYQPVLYQIASWNKDISDHPQRHLKLSELFGDVSLDDKSLSDMILYNYNWKNGVPNSAPTGITLEGTGAQRYFVIPTNIERFQFDWYILHSGAAGDWTYQGTYAVNVTEATGDVDVRADTIDWIYNDPWDATKNFAGGQTIDGMPLTLGNSGLAVTLTDPDGHTQDLTADKLQQVLLKKVGQWSVTYTYSYTNKMGQADRKPATGYINVTKKKMEYKVEVVGNKETYPYDGIHHSPQGKHYKVTVYDPVTGAATHFGGTGETIEDKYLTLHDPVTGDALKDGAVNANKYQVHLSDVGKEWVLSKLSQNDDFQFSAVDASQAVLTITPREVTVTLANAQEDTQKFSGSALLPDVGKYALSIDCGSLSNKCTDFAVTLQDGDLTTDPTPVTSVGDYQVLLSGAGKQKVQAAIAALAVNHNDAGLHYTNIVLAPEPGGILSTAKMKVEAEVVGSLPLTGSRSGLIAGIASLLGALLMISVVHRRTRLPRL